MYVNLASVTGYHVVIRDQEGTDSGGGVFATGTSTQLEFYNSSFIRLVAAYSGGGIHMEQSVKVHLVGCEFVACMSWYSGALHVDTKSVVLINATRFNGNGAGSKGGVAMISDEGEVREVRE